MLSSWAAPHAVLASGWIPFLITAVACLFFSVAYILWLRSSLSEQQCRFTTAVCVISLTFTLMSAAMVPVDVFLVSLMKYSNGTFKDWAADPVERQAISNGVLYAYYTFYSIVLFMAFLFLPMAFFYHALGPDEDSDHNGVDMEEGFAKKLCRAGKYTMACVSMLAVMITIGIFYPFSEDEDPGSPEQTLFTDYSLKEVNRFQGLVVFITNIVNSIGLVLLIMYTGYGMSAFPFGMMRGRSVIKKELAALYKDLEKTERRMKELEDEFEGREESMNPFERTELQRLRKEARLIVRKRHELDQDAKGFVNRCIQLCRPFQFFLGTAFALLGVLIFVSLLLTNVDKAINSNGHSSGFVLKNSTLPNPIDWVLLMAQVAFPLDYVLYSGMILFFILCSLTGVRKIGIRLFWLLIYRIKAGKTKPQALALLCFNLIFMLLALNVVMFSLEPDYTTFGNQYYAADSEPDGETKKCKTLDDAKDESCVMTRIAVLVLHFQSKYWIFGAFYYYCTWFFLVVIILGALVSACKIRREAPTRDEYTECLVDEEATFDRSTTPPASFAPE